MKIIDFENIYVTYGMDTVLKGVTLEIKNGENWAILGSNGSGKSTLMKLFSHDLYPNAKYSFKKEIFGRDKWNIFELKKYLGIVTNDLHYKFMYNAPNVSSLDVVLSGYNSSFDIAGAYVFDEKNYKEAQEVMDFLGIWDIKDKKVCKMSTGQLRRCIIGRALVHNPKAFVLDEPTMGLDIKTQNSFINILQKISKTTPIILITHNIAEIFPEITHVALMYNQTVFKQGRKEDILTSQNLSEIFELDVELMEENGRFYIKNMGSNCGKICRNECCTPF